MTTPVFIMGVAPRCGTNYLEDLLCVHPDCGLAIPLRENQLMTSLPSLAAIVRRHESKWNEQLRWGFAPEHADDLAQALGRGIIDFMVSQVDDRRRLTEPPDTLPGIDSAFKLDPRFLISKYPRPTGLTDFRRFFPDEKLVLLIRDGRAVAESSVRSWGWNLDVAIDEWREGAELIAAFLDANPDDPVLLVRYEDLITDPKEQVGRLLAHIGLDAGVFDWERALKRPVRGSSTMRPEGAERVEWKPVEKSEGFDPLARARNWTQAQHARFNHMAGDLSVRFGYPLEQSDGGGWAGLTNMGQDVILTARKLARPVRRRLVGRG